MKKHFFCLFLVFAIGLDSCSQTKDVFFGSKPEKKDYLIYIQDEQLIFYDPVTNVDTWILPGWDIDEFSLSSNNRLAFSSPQEGKSSIYVLEYPFTENTPIKITLDNSSINISPSWSQDGHYLLFDSIRADGKKLFLWDGKNSTNIYAHQGKISEVTWSTSGKLAFTEFFINDPSPDRDTGEVYLWDGNVAVSVSQNPSGEDRFPAWSKDGRLAFLSDRDGENDIFVWDGVSKNNGVPDVDSFENIAPSLTMYMSNPIWSNIDLVTFTTFNEVDPNAQIYIWDGQTARNISQNPSLHNGGQTWRDDGYWSFMTFFSKSQLLYIRDTTNQTVLETKGQYPPAWSPNGLLIFCVPYKSPSFPGWTLSMWNGEKIVDIAYGDFIWAMWNNGAYVFCASG